ncbi:hypothetical protein [Halalkalibacter akibai]|uniref:Uncharacterized protein n=1 Tax=Halalkalibacter akibai (strain ATCC 43226 / DSM 21942 / CIP 109018 / JCM 9157 / 1139) TaxID=1236973 RepID=W4R0J7_HALA3|nr:hypothetical protein [Halalkalibacter akibai]GAE37084.1 hypothetical protein JCM9157_4330 [Halalkalibacter akibai JCM 9157]
MTKKNWQAWQKEVLYEEYVKPDLSEQNLRKKLEQINKKYQNISINRNKALAR